jgi:hypothetical protein
VAAAAVSLRASPTGHFLENGSLHPPPAALRRFPCGSGLKWKKCTCKEYHQ